MKKYNILIATTAIMGVALCESALSKDEVTCPENSSEGSLCWKCGDNCTAKLETNGKMTISGTGDMYDYTSYYDGSQWTPNTP